MDLQKAHHSPEDDLGYVNLTIQILEDQIEDLSKISVYNEDFLNEEQDELKKIIESVKEKISKRKWSLE